MTSKRGRPKGAQEGAVRARIVAAAAEEFARAGYDGARLENVARKAGCNRAMIYFYFDGKAGLFEAALDETAEHRREQIGAQPRTLAEGLVYWFERNRAEPQRIRLIMQEALAPEAAQTRPERREVYLAEQLKVVQAFQAHGLLRSDLHPRHLLTMFLAITSFPACFPKIASVALGAPDETAVVEEWTACLQRLAEILAPPEEQGPADLQAKGRRR
ncbi:MAG TPA: TetR/AcrR family transcriptional regulator [Allosphingosinicella sp.]|nr:TetR/AcrR family transcriptional regulator [Allosphingosinicella sp.]